MTKIIKFKEKEYEVKYFLTEDEYAQFLSSMMISIFDSQDENALLYFVVDKLIFNKAILEYFAGVSDEDVDSVIYDFDEKGKCLLDIVKDNIYYQQYKDLQASIDKMENHQIKFQFHQDNLQNSIESKINQIMETILKFSDNLPKWGKKINKMIKSGEADKIIEFISPAVMKVLSGGIGGVGKEVRKRSE